MSIFRIMTLDGRITQVEEMDWSNDLGHVYTLQEAVEVCQGSESFHDNPFMFGKRAFDNAGRSVQYMVEAERWSLACQLVERLLEAGS